jgi:HlyD family secretion protein
MNATVVQNVVTYNTVINFDNPDLKLFPGMTAYVTIPVASASKVLKIPNGSLRFKPDMKADEIRALYTKYGIDAGKAMRAARQTSVGGQRAGKREPVGRNAGGGGDCGTQAQTRGPHGRCHRGCVRTRRLNQWVRTGITDHTVTEIVRY